MKWVHFPADGEDSEFWSLDFPSKETAVLTVFVGPATNDDDSVIPGKFEYTVARGDGVTLEEGFMATVKEAAQAGVQHCGHLIETWQQALDQLPDIQ